jgi:hypothetical protein
MTAGELDLANHCSLLRGEQAPEQLALVQRGQGRGTPRVVEQLDQAGGRIEHGRSRPANGEATLRLSGNLAAISSAPARKWDAFDDGRALRA